MIQESSPTRSIRHVILFDIDGTLISTGGAGRSAMGKAFLGVHGIANALDNVSLSGKTDPQIYQEVVTTHGVTPAMRNFRKSYLQILRDELPLFNGRGRVLPGVVSLLGSLTRRPDCLLGLLTGNWEAGAEMKLRYFGLHRYFRFGAFGDDSPNRMDLPRFARRRAREIAGSRLAADARFYVVGDTPRDVACALGAECVAVAVATGTFSVDELLGCGPHHVFETLGETECICRKLGLLPSEPAYPNCDAVLKLMNVEH